MSVEVDWGDVEQNVISMIADVEGPIRRKAGKKAGHKLGEALANNTPWQDINGRRSWKAQRDMDKKKGVITSYKSLKETVTVGPVNDDGYLKVGYGKDNFWRVHFVNMGTEFQSGQHFIEKTVETEARSVMEAYMEDLKAGLKL